MKDHGVRRVLHGVGLSLKQVVTALDLVSQKPLGTFKICEQESGVAGRGARERCGQGAQGPIAVDRGNVSVPSSNPLPHSLYLSCHSLL